MHLNIRAKEVLSQDGRFAIIGRRFSHARNCRYSMADPAHFQTWKQKSQVRGLALS
jgi:hypothetical protein